MLENLDGPAIEPIAGQGRGQMPIPVAHSTANVFMINAGEGNSLLKFARVTKEEVAIPPPDLESESF